MSTPLTQQQESAHTVCTAVSLTWVPYPAYRGVGAMEIVAMDMKVSGMYIARQLSFSGVTFRIEEIPLPPDFERIYNRAALLVSRGPLWARVAEAHLQDPSRLPLRSHLLSARVLPVRCHRCLPKYSLSRIRCGGHPSA